MLIWYQLEPSDIKVINLTRLNFTVIHLVFQYSLKICKHSTWRTQMGLSHQYQCQPGPNHMFPSSQRSRGHTCPRVSALPNSLHHQALDSPMKAAGIARREQECIRLSQVTPGVGFVEVPQQPPRDARDCTVSQAIDLA